MGPVAWVSVATTDSARRPADVVSLLRSRNLASQTDIDGIAARVRGFEVRAPSPEYGEMISHPLDRAFAEDAQLSTGQLADLATVLAKLDPEALPHGQRIARNALLFWVRASIVGAPSMGESNARSFHDY